MKSVFAGVLLLFCFGASAQVIKQIYSSPNLTELIAPHKIIAIFPFNCVISYRHPPKSLTAESNAADEKKMGADIQTSMYKFLIRKKTDYTVDIQDVDQTNALLMKLALTNKISETTKEDLAKALGVDAILSGDFQVENTKSKAGAIVSAALFYGGGTNKTAALTLSLHNGLDGELLWRFAKELQGTIYNSTDEVIEHMMRKVSRNFPYTKK